MSKTLIRGNDVPSNGEVLSTSEFIAAALDHISTAALKVKDASTSEEVLESFSDVLELMCSVLVSKNIDPEFLFEYATELRTKEGTFASKVAVTKEQ